MMPGGAWTPSFVSLTMPPDTRIFVEQAISHPGTHVYMCCIIAAKFDESQMLLGFESPNLRKYVGSTPSALQQPPSVLAGCAATMPGDAWTPSLIWRSIFFVVCMPPDLGTFGGAHHTPSSPKTRTRAATMPGGCLDSKLESLTMSPDPWIFGGAHQLAPSWHIHVLPQCNCSGCKH